DRNKIHIVLVNIRYRKKLPIYAIQENFFTIKLFKLQYFFYLTTRCKSQSKIDYNNYIHRVQSSLNTNPKLFWKLFSKKKLNSSFPNTSMPSIGGKVIVNCFASHFSSVYVDNLITPKFTYQFSSTVSNNLVDINLNSCTLSNEH
ncbi:Reverse transcriptase domain-containing protein, partial [Aphis craccivora]